MWYRHVLQVRCLDQTCCTGPGKGQKRPVHSFRTRHKSKLETCPFFMDRLCTHDGTCSRLEQVVQPLKLYYKVVELSALDTPKPVDMSPRCMTVQEVCVPLPPHGFSVVDSFPGRVLEDSQHERHKKLVHSTLKQSFFCALTSQYRPMTL